MRFKSFFPTWSTTDERQMVASVIYCFIACACNNISIRSHYILLHLNIKKMLNEII